MTAETRPAAPEQSMLTLRQAAKKTGMSTTTLRRYIKAGRIKARLIPGRYGPEYVVDEDDLRAAGLSLSEADLDAAGPGVAATDAGARTAGTPARADASRVPAVAPVDAVPGLLYRELLMKHEQLLVRYGMLRVGGQQLFHVREEAEARAAEARQAVRELERLRDRHAREIGRLRAKLRQAELDLAERDDRIRDLERELRRREIDTRNARRAERIEAEFRGRFPLIPSREDASGTLDAGDGAGRAVTDH